MVLSGAMISHLAWALKLKGTVLLSVHGVEGQWFEFKLLFGSICPGVNLSVCSFSILFPFRWVQQIHIVETIENT